MVLANMTFEIWRKARSKVERGGGVLGGRKEAELNMGEKVLKRETEKRQGIVPCANFASWRFFIYLCGFYSTVFITLLLNAEL